MNEFTFRAKRLLLPLQFGWIFVLFGGLFLAGCGREDVKTYRIPKEKVEVASADPHAQGAHAGGHGEALAAPKIQWKTPEGWQEMSVKGGMRAAQFAIAGKNGQQAEVSAIPLPGATAATRDIVNMWRDQIGIKGEEDVAGTAVAVGPAQGELFDMVSPNALIDKKFKARIMAALLKQEQTIWIFKMAGEDELVAGQKPAFLSFLKSIQFVERGESPVQEVAASTTPSPTAELVPKKPAWDAPANWKEQAPTQMLLAKYVVSGMENAQGEITISAFPGEVGGLLANINRWRGQIGLSPIEQTDLKKQISSFDVLGGQATLVDLAGTSARSGQKARLLGAIVQRGEMTWFYKMLGDEQVTEAEKPAFIKFVQSVRYPTQ